MPKFPEKIEEIGGDDLWADVRGQTHLITHGMYELSAELVRRYNAYSDLIEKLEDIKARGDICRACNNQDLEEILKLVGQACPS